MSGILKRPATYVGTQIINMNNQILIDEFNRRRRYGSADPYVGVPERERPATKIDAPAPRQIQDTATIERLLTEREGVKVRLGEQSVSNLNSATSKAVGSLSAQIASIDTKINAMGTDLGAKVDAIETITTLLTTKPAELKAEDIQKLAEYLDKLRVAGFLEPFAQKHRSMDYKEFIKEKPSALMYIIAKVDSDPKLSYEKPVYGRNGNPIELATLLLPTTWESTKKKEPVYFDLVERKMFKPPAVKPAPTP
jgi:hypothetical protein